MTYRPATAILELGGDFYDPVKPADFDGLNLRYKDRSLEQSVGLALGGDASWVERFGRFKPLQNSLTEPLALRYHGHQFRHYNPDIGDGRGFLYAQLKDAQGRLLDLGTKGSGQTPYSRQGDGRLTLLGGVREVLATRYLEHMGVNTSRTFCLIETDEALSRHDEPSPTRGAIMTRLQHSHIRFGTFQRQAFLGKAENLEALNQYCQRHFYPQAASPAELLQHVAQRSADLVASWMAAGFVHGVMNTDNMNITGECFDYGPYRFLKAYDPRFTAAYFDHNGLYAFGRQADAMGWNLGQLAQSLVMIEDDKALIKALEIYPEAYQNALTRRILNKLGVEGKDGQADIDFVRQTFTMLHQTRHSWPDFWHDWQGGAGRVDTPQIGTYEGQAFTDWLALFKGYTANKPRPDTDKPASLLYDEIAALWAPIAQNDDWSLFETKLESYENRSTPA
ncbi:MAG: protein adenylyltransferase SelO family protein [Litorimonas sp.]